MIRIGTISDLEKIDDLGTVVNSNFQYTYNIKEYLKNDNYIILLNEDKIVNGLLIVYKNIDYYELEIIVVDKLYRKQKIASNLMDYFIDNYCTIGDSILLEVAEDNISAINLYKKYGFESLFIRKNYYGNVNALVMKKVI